MWIKESEMDNIGVCIDPSQPIQVMINLGTIKMQR